MSQSSEKTRTVLVLGGPNVSTELKEALSGECQFVVVETIDDAMEQLRNRVFDAVVSNAVEFGPLTRLAGREEAETILERIGHGICTVDRGGTLLWANKKLQSYPSHAIERIREAATDMCRELASEPFDPDNPRSSHRSIDVEHEFYFDVTGSPVVGDGSQVEQAVAIVWDVSSSRRLQGKIDAIDAAGHQLVRLDSEALADMDVGERLKLLEEKIIRYSRELMHFQHFTVRILDRKTNKLDILLAEGMSSEAYKRQIYATTEGNGISGYVAATGRSYLCPDVPKDRRFLPGIEDAQSSLTVALRLHDQIVGILNVESNKTAAFNEDDRQFAEIFGRYIAIALNILQLLAVERHATTGQVTSDVIAELSAPLNDIVAQASTMMEDYIGHDDLRRRLHEVIDTVDVVKKRIHGLRSTICVGALMDEPTATDPILANKRILVADDEDVIRETIAAVLSKNGAIAVMAADGEQAIAMIHSQDFDLVISDINMPKKTGYEVFSAVKEVKKQCEVLLITGFGYDPDHSIVRASREGLAGVIFKPFKVELLLEEARKALSSHSQ